MLEPPPGTPSPAAMLARIDVMFCCAAASTNTYDPDGHLVTVTRTNGASAVATSMAHSASGKVQSLTDPNGNVTRMTYDPDDRLSNVIDPVGRVTSYAYDAMSRATSVTNTAIQSTPIEQRAYAPDGLLARLTD